MPRFHKIRCPNHYLRACIECIETPGFQIPTGTLLIMHALQLCTNWFRSNIGGMLTIVWNSLIFEYHMLMNVAIMWKWRRSNMHMQPPMQPWLQWHELMEDFALPCQCTDVPWCKQPGCQGIEVFEYKLQCFLLIRLYILSTTTPKITTQCPFFAPGLCLTMWCTSNLSSKFHSSSSNLLPQSCTRVIRSSQKIEILKTNVIHFRCLYEALTVPFYYNKEVF
jgi:hypothetical protein